MRIGYAALLALAGAAPAIAKDTAPCPPGLICASKPELVVAAMQKAGYKAELGKDAGGDPMIDSSANGYNFSVYFYDCENHLACASLQFDIGFKARDAYTAELVNKWNAKNRFFKAYIRDDHSLSFDHDLSTIGGITQANFTDQVGWTDSMIGQVDKFLSTEAPTKD